MGCCNTRFPDECNVLDVLTGRSYVMSVNSEFTYLAPVTIDDFAGPDLVLPFDFGSPPQWELEASTHSLTNKPIAGLGATTDLTLRIHVVETSSTIRCTARVETSMPFELFMSIVNGEQRNAFDRVHQGVLVVSTIISQGENTVVFRIENAEFDSGLERIDGDQFGTGRVWLEQCEISSG